MSCLNEDICSIPIQIQHHNGHLERVAHITGQTDVSLPKSYGLKYLENREKKKQMVKEEKDVIAKTNSIFAHKMRKIATEDRKQPPTLRLESANVKLRMNEFSYMEKNNLYMATHLEKTGSMLPSKEEFAAHHAKHIQQKKLLSRKFFGSLRNTHCHGEGVKPISQEEIDAKPQWVGVGSPYTPAEEEFASNDNNGSNDVDVDRNSKLRNKSRRKRPETPKSKPTNNHLKPKIEKFSFKIVNMPDGT